MRRRRPASRRALARGLRLPPLLSTGHPPTRIVSALPDAGSASARPFRQPGHLHWLRRNRRPPTDLHPLRRSGRPLADPVAALIALRPNMNTAANQTSQWAPCANWFAAFPSDRGNPIRIQSSDNRATRIHQRYPLERLPRTPPRPRHLGTRWPARLYEGGGRINDWSAL